jgi:hypothetical protein
MCIYLDVVGMFAAGANVQLLHAQRQMQYKRPQTVSALHDVDDICQADPAEVGLFQAAIV